MKVLVVIPAYNASRTIKQVIDRVPANFREDLLIINDGSSDCTERIVKKLGMRILSHPKNFGYGAAQKSGILFGLKNNYDIVVILHADGQYPPEKIPELVTPIQKGSAQVVIGSRMLKYSKSSNMPTFRYVGNKFLTLLENFALGSSLTGFHCGLRAYSVFFLRQVDFMCNSNGFEFDSEILFQAFSKGYIIKEVPINAHYGSEVSYLNPVKYGFSILKLIIKFIFHKYNIKKTKQFT